MTPGGNPSPGLVCEALEFLAEGVPPGGLAAPLQRARQDGYELDGCIQDGPSFAVWRGMSRDGVEVVIKHANGTGSGRARAVAQLGDEYQMLVSVKHGGITRPIDYRPGDDGYLVMVFEGDRDLAEWIKATRPGRKVLVNTISRVAAALSTLHESGLVHGDLKPQHVVIRDDGSPVLIDFGLAERWRDIEQRVRRTHRIGGTNHYMAPEVAERRVDRPEPSHDIYAFGVVLREAFEAAGIKPGAFKRVARQASLPDPSARYTDGSALLAAVRKAQQPQKRFFWAAVVLMALAAAPAIYWLTTDTAQVQIKDTPDDQVFGESPFGDLFPVRLPRMSTDAGILAWVCPEGFLWARQDGSETRHKAEVPSGIRDIAIAPAHIAVAGENGVVSVYTHELDPVGSFRLGAPVRSMRFDRAGGALHCWVPDQGAFVTTGLDGTVKRSLAVEADYIHWDTDHPGHAIAAVGSAVALIDCNTGVLFESQSPTRARITAADYDPTTACLALGASDGQAYAFDGDGWTRVNLRTTAPIAAVHASGFSGVAGEVLALDWASQRIVARYGTPVPGAQEMQLIVNEDTVTAVTPVGVGSWAIEHSR